MSNKPICALVIGHSPQAPGAENKATGLTEFGFNEPLSIDIADAVQSARVMRVYRESYKMLPNQLNKLKPDFIISLHCNAFNGRTSGTEVLYYHSSNPSKQLARSLHTQLRAALELQPRGIKPIKTGQRGSWLLRRTKAPCVIAEPFFIDNDQDLEIARIRTDALVKAYVDTIEHYAASL